MTDRYQAAIDGYEFDARDIEDGFDKAVGVYEYPYMDGAGTEDLGQRARRIRIRCYWLSDRYAAHYDFLNHLKSRALFELSHPKYGLLSGRIDQMMVRHDDRQETAAVDISFIEDIVSQARPIAHVDVSSATEESFITGQQEQMDAVSADVAAALGDESVQILQTDLDPDQSLLSQITGVTVAARAYLKKIDTFVAVLEAEAAAIANPANSLVALIDYGTKLPGRIIGTVAKTLERYSILYESIKSTPARFLQNLTDSMDDLADRAGDFSGHVRAAGSLRLAVEAAGIFATDEIARQKLIQREQSGKVSPSGAVSAFTGGLTAQSGADSARMQLIQQAKTAPRAFDDNGNYLYPAALDPVLSVRDLTGMLVTVRTALQATVDADRTIGSAKAVARQLTVHVNAAMQESDRITTLVLANPAPLHLVCLMQGLPYTAAPRIMAINDIDIADPNFVSGEIAVYVR